MSASPPAGAAAPIGVFDSGVGGLTVLSALMRKLPAESFVYLGDTARLPYGTKSPESIRRYALQAAALLHDRGVKCLVVACNTASAVALDALTREFAPVPVVGVLAGMLFLGERPGVAEFTALALVLASLFSVLYQPKARARPPATASEPSP